MKNGAGRGQRARGGVQRGLNVTAAGTRRTAVLVIDLINDFRFERGRVLWRQVRATIPALTALLERARRAGVPVIYVNDNLGRWQSDASQLITWCRRPGSLSRDEVLRWAPGPKDYFVLKPRHSGFYCTPLELLLADLDVHTLVFAGAATNACVWMTAADAHQRGFRIVVARDAVAAAREADSDAALEQMRRALGARVGRGRTLRFRGGTLIGA